MSETHRRIVLQFDRIRVVGIFFDFALPIFVIETHTGVDAMGAIVWLQNCQVEDPEAVQVRPRAAVTVSERVLYELLKTYCMSNNEKEQYNAGS